MYRIIQKGTKEKIICKRNRKLFIKFSGRKNRENWKKRNEYSIEKYCSSYQVILIAQNYAWAE